MASNPEELFDKRIVARNIKHQRITRKEHEQYLKDLEARGRYTHTVWTTRDGTWHSFPHNGIYTTYVAQALKYLPAENGKVGFGANPEFNPMLTVLEATPGLHLATWAALAAATGWAWRTARVEHPRTACSAAAP